MEIFEFGLGLSNTGGGTYEGRPYFGIDKTDTPHSIDTVLTPEDGPWSDALVLLAFQKREDVDWLIAQLAEFREEYFPVVEG